MIAAIYARYSSDNQREESIVAQLRACREYCARRGYNIIREYADEAMTGTKRPPPPVPADDCGCRGRAF